MKINDTVYFLENGYYEEAQIVMFGGNFQVLLDMGGTWVLKFTKDIKTSDQMYEEDWKRLSFYKFEEGLKMNEEMKKRFFELFTIDDLSEMEYALNCRFGDSYETTEKLRKFLNEVENKSK
jgi:hypothetical protein